MEIVDIKANKLKPSLYNPRQMTNKQYNDLKDSITKFGLVDPIIVNKDMTVIGGHQRLKILVQMDLKNIPCIILDLNKESEKELNIRLNKNTGSFDIDILANQFELSDLLKWGFKHIELGMNIDKIKEPTLDAIITIKEPDKNKASSLYKELINNGFNATLK